MNKHISASCISEFNNLHGDIRKVIIRVFSPFEPARVIIQGRDRQAIVATEKQVFIYKNKNKLVSWNHSSIRGIITDTHFTAPYIAFEIAGHQAVDNSWWGYTRNRNVVNSATAMFVDRGALRKLNKGVDAEETLSVYLNKIRLLIKNFAEAQSRSSANKINYPDETESQSNTNRINHLLDQLQKLGQLKEKGILTQEEFEVQKTKILNKNK